MLINQYSFVLDKKFSTTSEDIGNIVITVLNKIYTQTIKESFMKATKQQVINLLQDKIEEFKKGKIDEINMDEIMECGLVGEENGFRKFGKSGWKRLMLEWYDKSEDQRKGD